MNGLCTACTDRWAATMATARKRRRARRVEPPRKDVEGAGEKWREGGGGTCRERGTWGEPAVSGGPPRHNPQRTLCGRPRLKGARTVVQTTSESVSAQCEGKQKREGRKKGSKEGRMTPAPTTNGVGPKPREGISLELRTEQTDGKVRLSGDSSYKQPGMCTCA